jgi:hypothetical protein
MSNLEQRFRSVQAKENELRERANKLREANVTVGNSPMPNFPPFYPMLYHDISVEIPMLMQTFIRLSLGGVIFLAILSVVNWLACFTAGNFGRNSGENIVFRLIVLLFLTPLAFRVTYWKLYRQCKANEITFWTMANSGRTLYLSRVCWFIAAGWEFFLIGRLLLLFKSTGITMQSQADTGYAQAQ